MRAILLAAGLGTRLRPMTERIPKCLVPIRGKPLLGIWLDLLLSAEIDRVLINTHYLSGQVWDFIDESLWNEKVDLTYEPWLFGTGGTVLANRKWFGNEPVLVAHADNLTRFDVQAFIAHHEKYRPAITMMTFNTDNPQSCGIVEEKNGLVVGFHEKVANPPGYKANAAVYIFEPCVVDFMAGLRISTDISTVVLPAFLGEIRTFHNTDYHRDIGTIESLQRAQYEY